MTDEIFGAIRTGDVSEVVRLLKADAGSGHRRNADGVSPIMFAAYNGRADLASLIADRAGELDIFEATAVGRVDDVRRMFEAERGRAGEWSPDGFTALHFAAFFGQADVASLLIEVGADANAVARNAMHVQPLHSALARGDAAIAKALLDAGADANGQQQGGWTPLHEAARRGDRGLLDLLLAHGARTDIANADGTLASGIAAENGHDEIAALLGG